MGNSFVKAIAEVGVIPVILVRRTAIVEKRADEIILIGGNALAVTADVMDIAQFYSAKDKIENILGIIHGLVNAAGGNLREGVILPDADVFDLILQGMKSAIDLNIWGTIFPTQVFGQVIAVH